MIDAIDAPVFFRKGASVLVRCSGGELRKNVVWSDLGDVILVCAKDQFERMLGGYDAPMPIGFRRSDVKAVDKE